MKKFLIFTLLILLCSIFSFAQETPSWIKEIEDTINKKEVNCEIENRIWRSDESSFAYSLRLKCGHYQAAIQIDRLINVPNAQETFEGLVTAFDNTRHRNTSKTKLESFGDEGFIWTTLNKNSWTTIKYRKGDIFVNIFAPSEKSARKFAKYVLEEMP